METKNVMYDEEMMLEDLDNVVGGYVKITFGIIDPETGIRHSAEVDRWSENGVRYMKFLTQPDEYLLASAKRMEARSKGRLKIVDYEG